jgi:hypothetical protein
LGVKDPEAWVRNVEALYRKGDAEGVSALYSAEAITRFGSHILAPAEVHAHPAEWFDSLERYELTRKFRAAFGDIIVSETIASYITKRDGKHHREIGVDIYWVDDAGKIYHKHTMEVVQAYRNDDLRPVNDACAIHGGALQ